MFSSKPVHGRPVRSRSFTIALAAGVLIAGLVSPGTATAAAVQRPTPQLRCPESAAASVISWNETAAAVLATDAAMPAPTMGVGMAYVQAAVYNAVVGIEGRHDLYRWNFRGPIDASTGAAVAAAARVVLNHYFPAGHARVEEAYRSTLAAIPAGPRKQAGIDYGRAAGQHLLNRRSGDGWAAPAVYDRAPAPGVWRPTPPALAPFLAPWLAAMHPFLLRSPSQFRPGRPPALTSARYAADFAEVAAIGAAASTSRTPQQTETARFFSGNLTVQLQAAYRDHLTRRCTNAADASSYLLLTNMAAADALIKSWDSKVAYARWRPVTAIREANTDGNASTTGDPGWTPLIATPPFPEYTSAHCVVIGAVTTALKMTYGTDRLDLNISSPVTGTARHYEFGDALRVDGINARVWGGIHWRSSGEVGDRVGTAVGRSTSATLHHLARPLPWRSNRAIAW